MSNSIKKSETYFGDFGGMFVPEILIAPILAMAEAWKKFSVDPDYQQELTLLLEQYAGRPTPLTEVPNFARLCGKARIFLKREDLLHTGAHKINNAIGQCLLAKKMGKTRVIAETGAGQHGVAVAAVCARLNLQCTIYMGATDMARQAPNVLRMRLFGAEVIAVQEGEATLKEAVTATMRDWATTFTYTYCCIGSALGSYPSPEIVASLQSIIGRECQSQCFDRFGQDPDIVIACVGGGSNAIGIFSAFIANPHVQLIGVEGGGHGVHLGQHAARMQQCQVGVLHGCKTYLLQDNHGQVAKTSSISAGLDYPAIGPHHAHLAQIKRATYVTATDDEALQALHCLAEEEGILAALESAHALAYVMKIGPTLSAQSNVVINLSGRGDKDLAQLVAEEHHVAN